METNGIRTDPLILSLAFILAFEAVGYFAMKYLTSHLLVAVGCLRLSEIAVILTIFHVRGSGIGALGLKRDQLLPGVKKGLVWSAGFGALVGAGMMGMYVAGVSPFQFFHSKVPQSIGEKVLLMIVGGFIGPIAEEILFRGVLYGFFRKWGVVCAFILSTLSFVILHGGFGITQIIGGFIFCISYEIEGKLTTPIVIHALGNMALFTLAFFK
jgi:hypothetical protein